MAPAWLKRLFGTSREEPALERLPGLPYPPDLPSCRQVDLHPDGRHFLTVWGDQIGVHEIDAGRKTVDDICPAEGLRLARFSPDGAQVILGTRDDRAMLVDWHRHTVLAASPRFSDLFDGLHWLPDGRVVGATRSNEVVVLRSSYKTGESCALEVTRLAAPSDGELETFGGLALSPDGARLFVASGSRLRCLDSGSGEMLWEQRLDPPPLFPAVSPEGGRVAVARDLSVTLVDAATGVTVAERTCYRFRGLRFPWGGHERSVAFLPRLAFSPDGRFLASATPNGQLQLLDPVTLAVVREYPPAWVEDLAWFADSQRLLLGCANDRVLVWSVVQEACLVDVPVSTRFATGTD